MSASEKLKGLDAEYAGNIVERADEYHLRGGFLLAALPQIVAVIQAAEAADDAFENYRNAPDGELSDYAVDEILAKLVNQRIALTALEESLS